MRALGVEQGMTALAEAVRELKRAAPGDTGLDEALAKVGSHEAASEVADPRVTSTKGKRKHESLEEYVAAKMKARRESAAGVQEELQAEMPRKKKKKRRGKRESGASAESSSEDSNSSARGGDFWRVAEKKPRQTEKNRAWRLESGVAKRCWLTSAKWCAAHPPAKMGVRSHRELVTLATAVDALLAGKAAHCLDVLIQPMKVIEASLNEGTWAAARHLEIIPPTAASLTREDEREAATRLELRNVKLKEALMKASRGK